MPGDSSPHHHLTVAFLSIYVSVHLSVYLSIYRSNFLPASSKRVRRLFATPSSDGSGGGRLRRQAERNIYIGLTLTLTLKSIPNPKSILDLMSGDSSPNHHLTVALAGGCDSERSGLPTIHIYLYLSIYLLYRWG